MRLKKDLKCTLDILKIITRDTDNVAPPSIPFYNAYVGVHLP